MYGINKWLEKVKKAYSKLFKKLDNLLKRQELDGKNNVVT